MNRLSLLFTSIRQYGLSLLNRISHAPSTGDDEDAGETTGVSRDAPATASGSAPSRKRRREVSALASDADDDDSRYASATGPGRYRPRPRGRGQLGAASSAHAQSLVEQRSDGDSADESDQDLGDDDWEDEVGDDEVGDDEVIPGPEDDDIANNELELVVQPASYPPVKESDRESRFWVILRTLLVRQQLWAKKTDLKPLAAGERPMTLSFWGLLSRANVDFLMRLFWTGIRPEVKGLFKSQCSWNLDAFSSLKTVDHTSTKPGIYLGLAIQVVNGVRTIVNIYVGSAGRSIVKRVKQHQRIIQKRHLSTKDARSALYRESRQTDVKFDFRVFAEFSSPIPDGYLKLLEGDATILFNSVQRPSPNSISRWISMPACTLISELRGFLDLPTVPWAGLNLAWPLKQGFINTNAKIESPCVNPACARPTFPPSMKLGNRHLTDNRNPLGNYICSSCHNHRAANSGELSDAKQVAASKLRRQRLAENRIWKIAAGDDPACGCCGLSASQLHVSEKNFLRHSHFPELHICTACYRFVKKNGRLRDPKEIRDRIGKYDIQISIAGGQYPPCENCGCLCNQGANAGRRLAYNSKTELWLCGRCRAYHEGTGRMRDPALG
jgi:hypothetical protein